MTNKLLRKVREDGILDREFDQFGLNALKSVLKEMNTKTSEWAAAVPVSDKHTRVESTEPDIDEMVDSLSDLLQEFAKLDGYNVWRRSLEIQTLTGKLTPTDEGKPRREPTLLSWIVPVRQWAELESWGEDPETGEAIAKPTHQDGIIDPNYLNWLRDTLKIFHDDATVNKDFLDRLDPDCLEALDFNLSAGRHKPFVFDAGQHRQPAELINELKKIHDEIQSRLGNLLAMLEGKE